MQRSDGFDKRIRITTATREAWPCKLKAIQGPVLANGGHKIFEFPVPILSG